MNTKYTAENLKISQHAKERYSQRIMDRDSKSDVAVFIAQHEQKIKEDILKMIQYGEHIFSGKSVHEYNKQPVDIFLNGTWVVIVDSARMNVVTLYSIDLGLGQEFNEDYIGRLKTKLDSANEVYEQTKEDISTKRESYSAVVRENNERINEYKRIINELQKQNQGYTDIIETLDANRIEAESGVREVIATLIGKKVF